MIFTVRAEPLAIQQIPVSDEYYLRSWGQAEGWTDNRVASIAQTPDGYLWLGTATGLIRFDGVRFTPISTGTDSDNITNVFVSKKGTLWLGYHHGGIARLMGGRFESVAPAAPDVNWTGTFAEDPTGGVWFGYGPSSRIFRWEEGQLSRFGPEQGVDSGDYPHLRVGSDGIIWYWSRQGAGWFDGQRFHPVALPAESPFAMLIPAREGGVWMIDGTSLFRGQKEGAWKIVADLSWPGGPRRIMDMFEDSQGNLWIGTRAHGLLRYRDGHLVRVPTSSPQVITIAEDRAGNIWIGTGAGNINRLSRREFTFRKAPQNSESISEDAVRSMGLAPDGRMWLSQSATPVVAETPANRAFKPAGTSVKTGNTMTLLPRGESGAWLGTLRGLAVIENGILHQKPIKQALTGLLSDRRGNLWMAPIEGPLMCSQGDVFRSFPSDTGLVDPRALAEDQNGGIWVGTEGGMVFRSTGAVFVPVTLPAAEAGQPIRFIVPDGRNTVWIGAFKAGLYRWREGEIRKVPATTGFATEDIHALLIEPGTDASRDRFWITGPEGISFGSRDELEAVIEGRRSSADFRLLGRDDGLPFLEFSYGFLRTTARTPDGHLWFGSSHGALEIDPALLRSEPLFPLVIEELLVDGKAAPIVRDGKTSLAPQPASVQIQFTVPQMNGGSDLRFRFRMNGVNDAWEDAGDRRQANFTRLPPGNYRFEVAVGNGAGHWFPQTATLAFEVRAAWWQTTASRIAATVLAALAFGWLVRHAVLVRERARTRAIERERALERERIRIARDMHDELGASLTQISYASQLAKLDPPGATAQLNEIAAIAQRTVNSLDEIVWAVNPRNDTLSALLEYLALHSVNFLSGVGIACEVDIPAELPAKGLSANVRHHLFLSAKEALNNAAKHSGARTARLKVTTDSETVRIVIEDDGRGLGPAPAGPAGDGLGNMRDRMAEIGGTCHIDSIPEGGTRVVFQLPFSRLQL